MLHLHYQVLLISVELWRARIGTFSQPAVKDKFRAPEISITARPLRLFIWVTLCLGIVSTLQANHAYMAAKLQLSGDIELNPGPPPGFNRSADPKHDRMQTRLMSSQGQLSLGTEIDLEKEFRDLKTRVDMLEDENRKLKATVDRLEGQSRRNNLIVHGVEESDAETWDQCETKLRTVLKEQFGIDSDELQIEPAHRLGRRSPNVSTK